MTYRPFESSSDVTLRNMFHPRTSKIQSYISNLEILTLNTSGILGIQVQYISLDGTVVNKNDNFSNTPHSNTPSHKHPLTPKNLECDRASRKEDVIINIGPGAGLYHYRFYGGMYVKHLLKGSMAGLA